MHITYAIRDIKEGEIFKDMFVLRAPGKGILQHELNNYLGKKLLISYQNNYIGTSYFNNIIEIKDWKIKKFKKMWGLKCRFHDFPQYNLLSAPIIEFHCSQKDMYDQYQEF